jgi:hypothetical protein
MALGTSFYSGAFAPAKRTSPIDNTDYDLSDAYKPTGSTTQPERSLTGGATATDPGAGAHPFAPPGTSGTPGSGTSQPNIIRDVYAPQLHAAAANLESAYSAPRPGTARQVIGAILSRHNPALGGIVSGETQHQRGIQQAQEEYNIAGGQIQAARAMDTADITNQLHQSQAELASDRAKALLNPPPKSTPEEMAMQDYIKQGKSPAQAYAQVQQDKQDTKPDKTLVPPKQSEEDKALGDYLQGHGMADTPANRDRARSVLKTRDRPAKDPDLADLTKQLKEEQLRKMQEPSGPEKNRADLAKNLNENLDTLEEIVNRRPDLFGPGAGRMTELHMMIGSSDPDIAALQNIKHQAGMAQISAHGMRSAQGVDSAAQALMNFHNEPQAIKGAIHSARNSVGTFAKDVEDTRNRISGAAPAAAPAGPSVPSFADWKKNQH